jgi:hypothetical protein
VTCRDVSEFLQEFFAGELSENVANEFAGHLSGCTNCEIYIEQYRQAIVMGRTLLTEAETAEAPEELVRAIVASLRAAR